MSNKKRFMLIALSLLFTGCESKAATGALVGSAGGAVMGGAVGGGTGAAIGAAAGAAGGAIVGSAMDNSDRRNLEGQNPQTLHKIDNNQQLTLDDIKAMSQAGMKDDTIIAMIQKTRSQYDLRTADVIELKNAGVRQKVIDYMINNT